MDKISINSDFNEYMKIFLEENSKLNLISKNDEKFLFEKHIYDSLSIKLFFEKYKECKKSVKTILDIGCGGGFPCIPLTIEYPEINITGIDSIKKKISSAQNIKTALKLNNLELICIRAENLKGRSFDIVVSRAVADFEKICGYALPLLKTGGHFIAYKSKKVQEEIKYSRAVLKKYHSEIIDIIKYSLPLEEIYERNLIIVKKI